MERSLGGDAVGGVAGDLRDVWHPVGGEGVRQAVVGHGFAGELAEAAIDDAGAEVFRIEKDLLLEDVRVGGGGCDGVSNTGAGGKECGECCREEVECFHDGML